MAVKSISKILKTTTYNTTLRSTWRSRSIQPRTLHLGPSVVDKKDTRFSSAHSQILGTNIGTKDMQKILAIQNAALLPKEDWRGKLALLESHCLWKEIQAVIEEVDVGAFEGNCFPYDVLKLESLAAFPFRDQCGTTPLIWSIARNKLEHSLVEKILEGAHAQIGAIQKGGNTALIWACIKGLESIALRILETGEGRPGHVNNSGCTALIWSCRNGIESVALRILETGEGRPGQVNNCGDTALIWACYGGIESVALRILETGQGRPGQADDNGYTALAWSCNKGLESVALRILETSQGQLEQITDEGDTALILACCYNLGSVALRILDIGKGRSGHINFKGETALWWAIKNNITEVISRIRQII